MLSFPVTHCVFYAACFSKSNKKTPFFIQSGYLEPILHRPQLQCLVALFLFIRFLFPSLVLSLCLCHSTAFKNFTHLILSTFQSQHANAVFPSVTLQIIFRRQMERYWTSIEICALQQTFKCIDRIGSKKGDGQKQSQKPDLPSQRGFQRTFWQVISQAHDSYSSGKERVQGSISNELCE